MNENPTWSKSLSAFGLVSAFLFNSNHLNMCLVVLIVVLIGMSLRANDFEHLLICSFAICISSWVKYLCKYFAHLKLAFCLMLSCWAFRVLYVFWNQVCYQKLFSLTPLSSYISLVFVKILIKCACNCTEAIAQFGNNWYLNNFEFHPSHTVYISIYLDHFISLTDILWTYFIHTYI